MRKFWSTLLGCCFILLLGVSESFSAPVYNNHLYTIVDSGQNGAWDNAENNAIAWGGHLVTINDVNEENWLKNVFGTEQPYWIGLNDAANEGSWVWSSGEAVTYTNWAGGEPNNCTPPDRGEDYVVMNWYGAWNDFDHQRPDYWHINGIAEKPVPEPATVLLLGSGLLGMLGLKKKKD